MAVAVASRSRARLRLDAWEEYAAATRGERFEWWAAENLYLGQSQWAGRRMVLEAEWQAPILYEALAVNGDGTPYWRMVAIIVPRKNAKTNTLSALACFELDEGGAEAEILMAAASAGQADKLFGGSVGFYQRSKIYGDGRLRESVHLREYQGQIAHVENGGKIHRLAGDGDNQHGWNPSKVFGDEIHAWRQPKHLRNWGALTTADGARDDFQAFTISTEGERLGWEDSILGKLVSDNEAAGDVERVPGLTVSRDHASRTVVFRFHAVDAGAANPAPLRAARAALKAAPGDGELARRAEALERGLLDSVMPANPASWISEEYILRQALSAKVMPAQFMQLHANVAADVREAWISRDQWGALQSDAEIPDGAEVAVAVDSALTHDSTAVSWAARLEDGRVVGRCHTWAARPAATAHEHVVGGRIRNEPVKAFIRALGERYSVAELVYDPRFFEDAAMELADEGFVCVPMVQSAAPMRDAEQQFFDAVQERLVTHDGDRVLAAHVAAAAAEKTDAGWRIRKLRQSEVIDGLVSLIMSHYRARRFVGVGGFEWGDEYEYDDSDDQVEPDEAMATATAVGGVDVFGVEDDGDEW